MPLRLCKNCRFFREFNYCLHPNNGISLITGDPSPIFCTTNRQKPIFSGIPVCGESGDWYEELPKKVSYRKWYNFWSKS